MQGLIAVLLRGRNAESIGRAFAFKGLGCKVAGNCFRAGANVRVQLEWNAKCDRMTPGKYE